MFVIKLLQMPSNVQWFHFASRACLRTCWFHFASRACDIVHRFYGFVGLMPVTTGGTSLVINNYSRAIAPIVVTASIDIASHVIEEVQNGMTGKLPFCLNSDADDDGTTTYSVGDQGDASDAIASYFTVAIDCREVPIPSERNQTEVVHAATKVLARPKFFRST